MAQQQVTPQHVVDTPIDLERRKERQDRRQAALAELEGAKEDVDTAQRLLALLDLEPRLQAFVDGLDDRTRFIVAGLADIGTLETKRDVNWAQDLWSEVASDEAFLDAKAPDFEDDPELGPLAKAVMLTRGFEEADETQEGEQ